MTKLVNGLLTILVLKFSLLVRKWLFLSEKTKSEIIHKQLLVSEFNRWKTGIKTKLFDLQKKILISGSGIAL